MRQRAFPVIYTEDVGRLARFYGLLGYSKDYQFPPEGDPGYVSLRRGDSHLGVVTVDSPIDLIGVRPGTDPRFEMFVYVDDVDRAIERLGREGVRVLRGPEDMPWGERVGYVQDPDGNPVALANAS